MERNFDINEEIRGLKLDIGMIKKTDCTLEENLTLLERLKNGEELPENIRRYKNPSNGSEYPEFYRVDEPKLSRDEMNEYLMLLQCKYLKSIKWGVYFFVTLAVISLVLGFVLLLGGAY